MKEIKCNWCGKLFKRDSPASKYCCDECRKNARQYQSRMKSHRWYHKHKNELTEKQRYGLGSGRLGMHRNPSFESEKRIVCNELKRLMKKRII